MSNTKVLCIVCGKRFYQQNRYLNWNLKFGLNSYCSKTCSYTNRTKGNWLICENKSCKNRFYRQRHAISKHNFCSKSCAAVFSNLAQPRWPKRFCSECRKEFKNRESDYCSTECGYHAISKYRSSKSKYSKEQILSLLKKFNMKHGRAPAKREVLEIVSCATNHFSSWNAAITAAGLRPHRSHDHQMYRRTRTKARDGHLCDSISEAIIDNWLHKNSIPHIRDAKYPTTKHKADWAIQNGKVFIEYFGLAQDSPRYDKAVKLKQQICKKNRIKLIEIYPSDLYPTVALERKFNNL